MEPIIRPYVSTDVAACQALWLELVQHHRNIYGDPQIGGHDPGSGFDRYLTDPALRGPWVAEREGVVVGLAGLLVQGESAEIEPVVVASASRAQGIGMKLVRHMINEARALGLSTVRVKPVARNIDAISFFVSLGFDTVAHIDLFQSLQPTPQRTWKKGLLIQGHDLQY